MPSRRCALLVTAVAAILALAAPSVHAGTPARDGMGVFVGEPTTAGDWYGTWMYVWRDGRMALWFRAGKDGKPEVRLQFQSTANPETFETDWSGKSTYYLSGQAATFEFRLTKRDKDGLAGRWDWNVDFADSGRSEKGDVRIYRVGDGRMLAFEFQDGYARTLRRGDRVTKQEIAPVFNFVKASRRIVLWDERPW